MLQGLVLLLVFQFVGEALANLLGLPIPGNVIGMALLLISLMGGLIKEQMILEASELLLSHLALFFVPAGVGVMLYFGLIQREWLPIVFGTVFSTFAVMAVTGWTERLLEKGKGASND